MDEGASAVGGGSSDKLANIQLNDMAAASNLTSGAHPRKKKVIYFSDGSTMEDYDDDENDASSGQTGTFSVEEKISKSTVAASLESAPHTDPVRSKMQWSEWMRHQTSKAGTKTLTVLEGMGGTAAYYLGITTPKYQSEIDEYNRMVAKKKSHEEELVSWSTGPKAQPEQPVVEDIKGSMKSDDIAVKEDK